MKSIYPNHNCVISVYMLHVYTLPYSKIASSKEHVETLHC